VPVGATPPLGPVTVAVKVSVVSFPYVMDEDDSDTAVVGVALVMVRL
jgi:hypothetical protein